MAVTHVIFDLDGLLIDTESCYTIANQTLLRKYGREYTLELNAKMMGRKEDEAFAWLLKEVGIDDKVTVKDYLAEYDAMLDGMFLKCRALPGAERLVRHLSKKDVRFNLFGFLEIDVCALKHVKPHKIVFCWGQKSRGGKPQSGDLIWATMNRFPVKPKSPSDVLVFEDAPNGGRAAKAAGMKCVMVPAESHRQEALQIG
ncbi:HAD hydrolase, family IA, variant 3 [Cooperia oncophora]